MEEQAKLTGDVIDTRDTEKCDGDYGNGDLYFLLEDSTHRFTISLENVLECLKFAEDQYEIEPLPSSFWWSAWNKYPNMYRGKERYEDI